MAFTNEQIEACLVGLRTPLVSGPIWLAHVNTPFVFYLC